MPLRLKLVETNFYLISIDFRAKLSTRHPATRSTSAGRTLLQLKPSVLRKEETLLPSIMSEYRGLLTGINQRSAFVKKGFTAEISKFHSEKFTSSDEKLS